MNIKFFRYWPFCLTNKQISDYFEYGIEPIQGIEK